MHMFGTGLQRFKRVSSSIFQSTYWEEEKPAGKSSDHYGAIQEIIGKIEGNAEANTCWEETLKDLEANLLAEEFHLLSQAHPQYRKGPLKMLIICSSFAHHLFIICS
jgi:hypothetical protein